MYYNHFLSLWYINEKCDLIFYIVNKQSKGCVDGSIAIKSCLTLHILKWQKKQKVFGFYNRYFFFKYIYSSAGWRLKNFIKFESSILAQNERWRQAWGMQVERESVAIHE